MFRADLRFEGFSHADWTRLLALLAPVEPAARSEQSQGAAGGVLAVVEQGRVVKALHIGPRRVNLEGMALAGAGRAEALARRAGARWAVCVQAGALEAVSAELGARARPTDDLADQARCMIEAFGQQVRAGRIDVWPGSWLWRVPLPGVGAFWRALDLVCPPERTIVVGSFAAGELWTALALRRGSRAFDWILGPGELRGELGPLTGPLAADGAALARVVAARTGPVGLGCYAERDTWAALRVSSRPGRWARAVDEGRLIVQPRSAALSVALWLDGAAALLSRVRARLYRQT